MVYKLRSEQIAKLSELYRDKHIHLTKDTSMGRLDGTYRIYDFADAYVVFQDIQDEHSFILRSYPDLLDSSELSIQEYIDRHLVGIDSIPKHRLVFRIFKSSPKSYLAVRKDFDFHTQNLFTEGLDCSSYKTPHTSTPSVLISFSLDTGEFSVLPDALQDVDTVVPLEQLYFRVQDTRFNIAPVATGSIYQNRLYIMHPEGLLLEPDSAKFYDIIKLIQGNLTNEELHTDTLKNRTGITVYKDLYGLTTEDDIELPSSVTDFLFNTIFKINESGFSCTCYHIDDRDEERDD